MTGKGRGRGGPVAGGSYRVSLPPKVRTSRGGVCGAGGSSRVGGGGGAGGTGRVGGGGDAGGTSRVGGGGKGRGRGRGKASVKTDTSTNRSLLTDDDDIQICEPPGEARNRNNPGEEAEGPLALENPNNDPDILFDIFGVVPLSKQTYKGCLNIPKAPPKLNWLPEYNDLDPSTVLLSRSDIQQLIKRVESCRIDAPYREFCPCQDVNYERRPSTLKQVSTVNQQVPKLDKTSSDLNKNISVDIFNMTDSYDELFLQVQDDNANSDRGGKAKDKDCDSSTASEEDFLPNKTETVFPNPVNVDSSSSTASEDELFLQIPEGNIKAPSSQASNPVNKVEENNPEIEIPIALPQSQRQATQTQYMELFQDDMLLFEDDFDESGDAILLDAAKEMEGTVNDKVGPGPKISPDPFNSPIPSLPPSPEVFIVEQEDKENLQQQQNLYYNDNQFLPSPPSIFGKKSTVRKKSPLIKTTPAAAFDNRNSDDELVDLTEFEKSDLPATTNRPSTPKISPPMISIPSTSNNCLQRWHNEISNVPKPKDESLGNETKKKFVFKRVPDAPRNVQPQRPQTSPSPWIDMAPPPQKPLFGTAASSKAIATTGRPASQTFKKPTASTLPRKKFPSPCSDDDDFRSPVRRKPGASFRIKNQNVIPSPGMEVSPRNVSNTIFSSSPISSRNPNMDRTAHSARDLNLSFLSATESPVRRRKKRRRVGDNPFLELEADVSEDASTDGSHEEFEGLDKYDSSFVDSGDDDGFTSTQQIRYIKSVKDIIPVDARLPQPRVVEDTINVANPEDDADYDSDSFCIVNDEVEFADVGVFTQAMNVAKEAVLSENQTSAKKIRTRRQVRARMVNTNPGTSSSAPQSRRRRRIICADSSSDE